MGKQTEILFLSHGGGPMPLLGDPGHKALVDYLTEMGKTLRTPSAILVISAHWEESIPTITSAANPSLIYDYYGFPAESYQIQYPCPGEPKLAGQIHQALTAAGIEAQLDDTRGFDHGVFVPLKLIYPNAEIPCVQLSLVNSLNPDSHLAIGKALQALDYDNLLVIGSGFSFHNMRAFFSANTPEVQAKNQAFEDWLKESCCNPEISETERAQRLSHWEQAPHARFCHPREEHLLPLHLCYGMAGKASDKHTSITVLNKKSGMFYWLKEES